MNLPNPQGGFYGTQHPNVRRALYDLERRAKEFDREVTVVRNNITVIDESVTIINNEITVINNEIVEIKDEQSVLDGKLDDLDEKLVEVNVELGDLEQLLELLDFDTSEALLHGVTPVDELPGLPDDDFPPGKVVFLTTNGKLHRNYNNEWTAETSAEDLTGEVDPDVIPDGAITSSRIADFAVTAKKFNTASHIIF